MEIVEIFGYELNHGSDSLEVRFRLIEDSEGEIRIDNIEMSEADDFGFVLISEEDMDFYDEEDDFVGPPELNETELLSFLNEYYLVYPDRLPKKE